MDTLSCTMLRTVILEVDSFPEKESRAGDGVEGVEGWEGEEVKEEEVISVLFAFHTCR